MSLRQLTLQHLRKTLLPSLPCSLNCTMVCSHRSETIQFYLMNFCLVEQLIILTPRLEDSVMSLPSKLESHDYTMALAFLASTRSKDEKTQVNCYSLQLLWCSIISYVLACFLNTIIGWNMHCYGGTTGPGWPWL